MNLFINSLLIVIFFSFAATGQDCKANVTIYTDVEKVNLFINDTYKGEGNNFNLLLEPATYKIRIVEDYKKWNANQLEDTLRVNDCRDLTFNYNLTNKIFFDSNPQNTYVKESDSLIGFTPLMLEDNFETLLLQKPDYADQIITQQEIATGVKPELEFIGQLKGESFYESTLFKVLVGTAIALGATTAYYKLEADKNFDEYQITGDPASLNQTEKYDLISGTMFVAMQIDFGLILYLFLAD
jgi:hypothetical protein